MPPSTLGSQGIKYASGQSGCLSVHCPLVNNYFVWCGISLFSGATPIKLDINVHHVSGNCWKGYQGQRSKVKVMRDQCAQMSECYNGRDIHFDAAALRPTCYPLLTQHFWVQSCVGMRTVTAGK